MARVMLNNVRVSFPALFKNPQINGKEAKMGAKLLLDQAKDAAAIQQINETITRVMGEKWGANPPQIPADKFCLRMGNRPEYQGAFVLTASNKNRPWVWDSDGQTRIEDESRCRIYSGCRVNAAVDIYAFVHKQYGAQVSAELVAIQFNGDDVPLEGGVITREQAAEGFGSVNTISPMPGMPQGYPAPAAPQPQGYPAPAAPQPQGYPAPAAQQPQGYPATAAPQPQGYPAPAAPQPQGYPAPAGNAPYAPDTPPGYR